LALPIIQKLVDTFGTHEREITFEKCDDCYWIGIRDMVCDSYDSTHTGKDIIEAALRALVAWKFPDGLPEPIYEKE